MFFSLENKGIVEVSLAKEPRGSPKKSRAVVYERKNLILLMM